MANIRTTNAECVVRLLAAFGDDITGLINDGNLRFNHESGMGLTCFRMMDDDNVVMKYDTEASGY